MDFFPLKGLDVFNVYNREDYLFFFENSKPKIFSIRKEKIRIQGKDAVCCSTILYSRSLNKLLLLPSILLYFEDKWFYPDYLYPFFGVFKKYFFKIAKKSEDLKFNEVRFFNVPLSLRWLIDDSKKLDRFYLCLNDFPTALHHLKRYHLLYSYLRILNPPSILEIGPGMGYFINKLVRYNYYFYEVDEKVCDLISYIDLHDKAKYVDIYDSRSSLKFPFVFFLEVLEHVNEPFSFLRRVLNFLKEAGSLYFSVPDETFGGSHLNPEHITNWNFERVRKFVNYFLGFDEDTYFFQEKFDFSSDNWLKNSEILNDYPESKEIESYVVSLKGFSERKSFKKARVIIVKRTAAIGDVLLIEPIIRALKFNNPDALILLLTKYTELFKGNPFVDILMKYSYYGENIPDFDIEESNVINLDFAYEKIPELSIMSAYKKVANLSNIYGTIPNIYLNFSDLKFLRYFLSKFEEKVGKFFVVINIGRKQRRDRTLPPDFVREIARFLVEKNYVNSVFFVGSPDNFSPGDYSLELPYVNLVGVTNLSQVAAILSVADLLIAPDTGLIHLASAVGCNSIGIFGMADPGKRVDYAQNLVYPVFPDVSCRGCLHKKITIDPKCEKKFDEFPECMLLESNIRKTKLLISNLLGNKTSELWRKRLRLLCDEG